MLLVSYSSVFCLFYNRTHVLYDCITVHMSRLQHNKLALTSFHFPIRTSLYIYVLVKTKTLKNHIWWYPLRSWPHAQTLSGREYRGVVRTQQHETLHGVLFLFITCCSATCSKIICNLENNLPKVFCSDQLRVENRPVFHQQKSRLFICVYTIWVKAT